MHRLAYNGDVAAGQLAVFQGESGACNAWPTILGGSPSFLKLFGGHVQRSFPTHFVRAANAAVGDRECRNTGQVRYYGIVRFSEGSDSFPRWN